MPFMYVYYTPEFSKYFYHVTLRKLVSKNDKIVLQIQLPIVITSNFKD